MWKLLFFIYYQVSWRWLKIRFFRKVYLPMKPTECYCFCLFHLQDLKPKRNHQIASSRAKIRSRQSQTCVKYRGNVICIKTKTDVNTSDLKKTSQKNVQIRLIFQRLSSISPKINVFFVPPYAWLESYGHHGSFGSNISGSLSFSPVLWVLSSCNTLNVTHSDTA